MRIMRRIIILNESDIHRIVRCCVNEILESIQTPQILAKYGELRDEITDISRLPRNMAYRETDINELEDMLECGYMRRLPNNKTVQGAKRTVTVNGHRFQLGKTYGNSHGGKGFSKGGPWTSFGGTLTRGTGTKAIIGIPGNATNWQVGHHGSYSEAQPFNQIEHGRPLFLRFGDNGRIGGINVANIRMWVSDLDGNYHEFIPYRR